MPLGPSSIAVGAALEFRMVSTADGFAGLYVLSASGRTQAWLENVRLRAGEPIVFPQQGLIVRATPRSAIRLKRVEQITDRARTSAADF